MENMNSNDLYKTLAYTLINPNSPPEKIRRAVAFVSKLKTLRLYLESGYNTIEMTRLCR
jgi:hypothetical protein